MSAMNAQAQPTAGVKRRRSVEPKFYAVRIGYNPGVYHDWSTCFEQIKGYKNAQFKSFPTLTEAEFFVQHGLVRGGTGSTSNPTKFYAVRNGRIPGVYYDWPTAQKQVVGWSKPMYKSFSTKAEAEAFVRGDPTSNNKTVPQEGDAASKAKTSQGKKQKRASVVGSQEGDEIDYDVEAGTGPLPIDAEDGFDTRVIFDPTAGRVVYKTEKQRNSAKMQAVGATEGSMLHIWTDGSSLNNGTESARAGVGVYFGPKDPRNVAERLEGQRQTNQRAELTAIQRAIDITPRDRHVTIHSDSKYSINCVTVWFANWRENGWMTSAKKPVENKDLIENIINKIDERFYRSRVKTEFVWVKGHANDPGNEAADDLAIRGASLPQTQEL